MLPIVLDRMHGGCSGRVPLLSIESGAEHHRETDGRQVDEGGEDHPLGRKQAPDGLIEQASRCLPRQAEPFGRLDPPV